MPQPTQQPPRSPSRRAGRAAAGAAAVGAAGGAVVAVTPPAAAGAVNVAAAKILGGFVAWLSAMREQHQRWLAAEVGGRVGRRDDLAALVEQEMVLEREFARNAADRLAGQLPQALRIADPRERERRVRQILADEERFARMRAEAMAARAFAAAQRSSLRQTSPLGAYWKLGLAHQHTEGCKFMEGKFWPWAVLDRCHPPRHYGCTSSLHSYADAVLEGLMGPSDVPDTREAVRMAAGVVMEAEEARAVLAELDVRDRLAETGVASDALVTITFKGVRDGS